MTPESLKKLRAYINDNIKDAEREMEAWKHGNSEAAVWRRTDAGGRHQALLGVRAAINGFLVEEQDEKAK
jgi:hypothetical protein